MAVEVWVTVIPGSGDPETVAPEDWSASPDKAEWDRLGGVVLSATGLPPDWAYIAVTAPDGWGGFVGPSFSAQWGNNPLIVPEWDWRIWPDTGGSRVVRSWKNAASIVFGDTVEVSDPGTTTNVNGGLFNPIGATPEVWVQVWALADAYEDGPSIFEASTFATVPLSAHPASGGMSVAVRRRRRVLAARGGR